MMVIILVSLFWVSLFFIIVFSITTEQKKKAKLLLTSLKEEKFVHYKVRFLQMQTSKFTAIGGIWIKVDLYFNANLILIAPNSKGHFNGMNNFNLPVIITNDVEYFRNKTYSSNVKKPTEINFPWNKTMKIKYTVAGIIDKKYDIQIRFNQKEELENFKLINNMYNP